MNSTTTVGAKFDERGISSQTVRRKNGPRTSAHQLFRADIRPWLIPVLYSLGAITAGFTIPRLTSILLPKLVSTMSVGAAVGIYSAIASGMIALTGIVFSLAFVMVQFSATAYSPRLVLWIARDPVVSHALGIFTATFFYALTALAWVDRGGSGRVQLSSLWIVVALLLASMAMFISLIHRIGMLQINRMLVFTGDQGRKIVAILYPPIETLISLSGRETDQTPSSQTILHHGKPQFVQSVNVEALMELASRNGSVIEVLAAVGDCVFNSTPIMRVLGGNQLIPQNDLLQAIEFGGERTFEQDPKYAIRLLVDIAIKALSPAINDPTTAVQALDQIEDLLLRLGNRRLEIGAFLDSGGNLRVLIPFPSWEDFLLLAFDEIRFYGANSVQVMRRMKALVSELISALPQERHDALVAWRLRLQATIDRSFDDAQDKLDASTEDRQGLGINRQKREPKNRTMVAQPHETFGMRSAADKTR
jgi:uncharacterized membrane protein